MTRALRRTLLIASLVAVTWASTSEACHRRRAVAVANPCYASSGYATAGATEYYGSGGGYVATGGGYYGASAGYGQAGYGYGQPGYGYGQPGYDFGRPGYNPGGLGGPMSGLGVRPGLGFGGFGPGR